MQNTGPGGISRRVKWVLGLSLALNLLVVGAIGGAVLRQMGKDGPGRGDRLGPIAQAYGAPYVRALPKEARRSLGQSLRAGAAKVPTRAERQAMMAEMLESLRSDPFDADAMRAVFDRQRTAALEVQAAAQAEWLKIVSDMSAAERAALAERLEEVLKRSWKKRRAN